VHGVQMAREHLLAIMGRQPEHLLQEKFIPGLLPREQRHAGEERRGPVVYVVEAIRAGEEVPIHRPRGGLGIIGQPLDVAPRLPDAKVKCPPQQRRFVVGNGDAGSGSGSGNSRLTR
jgi:hypothetical protein